MARSSFPVVRHLTVAQALYVGGSTVDLTLTGIVGARLAPTPVLATLPFTIIFVTAGISTFFVSGAIGGFGHRTVFTAVAGVAAVSGCVSAVAIQLGLFWLFCLGTALIGVLCRGNSSDWTGCSEWQVRLIAQRCSRRHEDITRFMR